MSSDGLTNEYYQAPEFCYNWFFSCISMKNIFSQTVQLLYGKSSIKQWKCFHFSPISIRSCMVYITWTIFIVGSDQLWQVHNWHYEIVSTCLNKHWNPKSIYLSVWCQFRVTKGGQTNTPRTRCVRTPSPFSLKFQ